jgi:DNA-binding response OmpR family regulator
MMRILIMGADDYLLKPFNPYELSARVRCLLALPGSVVAATASAIK